ncbi:ABC transporter permease subunit [Ferruginibacter paludis]|uniref:ABC transporter permease subunit n=1 Tax=Ferruginibacter paludis TaxID=1310417 RepID=UPI0025B4E840|nr:ABC transporter permease subunit [Ferruginibacter paludis]MDN3657773.1 ABC transporter permease subunit [Ferruginibacter paludis]
MIQLLKIEWLKIKNYNAFIILSSFFALGVVAVNYVAFSVYKNMISEVNAAKMMSSFSPYDFDRTWHTTSYFAGCILLLPGLLIIMLVTNEFTYRTHRQNIIDGWSRKQFIEVKIVLAIIAALASTALVILTALVFGLASGTSFSLEGFSITGIFFLKALTYNMVALLISVLIRRTGFATGMFFIYMGFENFVSQLLDIWSIKLRRDNTIDLGSMGDYLPMNAADGLLTFPDNPVKSLARGVLPTNYTPVVMVLCAAYLVLFCWWSYNRIIKTDL